MLSLLRKKKVKSKPVQSPQIKRPAPLIGAVNRGIIESLDASVEPFDLKQQFTRSIQRQPRQDLPVTIAKAMDAAPRSAMDDFCTFPDAPAQANLPDAVISWYANQGFIGFQMCAILAQNWLVSRACTIPAEDAVRNGYDISINDGTKVNEDVIDKIRKLDVEYKITENMKQFIEKGRIYGIRVAVFLVDSDDPDYYEKPFNLDGIKPGSYRGIAQVDPFWITPELDAESVSEPLSLNFYEPKYWRVRGRRIEKSHCVIYRNTELPDILKPTYFYGGISVTQKIYELVYNAQRTANEVPMLALTKRLDVLKVDSEAALMKQEGLIARLQRWIKLRTNFGIKVIGLKEEIQQFDTSLSEMSELVDGQFNLVSAASGVPTAKLMEKEVKGFNSSGEYEENSYHETLKSIQKHHLTRLLERHHAILIRSEILPQSNVQPFDITVIWHALNETTASEEALINKTKAETGATLINAGVLDREDERKRIINDPKSGYSGLIPDIAPDFEEDENQNDEAKLVDR